MLRGAGVVLAATVPFPDHRPFSEQELRHVLEQAARLDAAVVTTPKDAVRLPAAYRARIGIVGVSLVWDDAAALEALLDRHA
jgi:tetraacyldisaccharide 4'-kinase